MFSVCLFSPKYMLVENKWLQQCSRVLPQWIFVQRNNSNAQHGVVYLLVALGPPPTYCCCPRHLFPVLLLSYCGQMEDHHISIFSQQAWDVIEKKTHSVFFTLGRKRKNCLPRHIYYLGADRSSERILHWKMKLTWLIFPVAISRFLWWGFLLDRSF